MFREITIIGGAGHVGLAFALICAKKNIKVHINDINSNSIKLIQKGKMPHKEKNGKKILDYALKNNLFTFSTKFEDIKLNKINIICLGTPIDEFLNPQYNIIINLFNNLNKYLKNGQHFIIRSTVSPGTTNFIHDFLKKKQKKLM
mgnify:FL=1